ncbi:MAG: hypothetical protein V1720_10680 [bacterium]
MTSVLINIPDEYFTKAKYVFELLSVEIGLPLKIFREGNLSDTFNIIYSSNPDYSGFSNSIFIPFDEELFSSQTECEFWKDGENYFWRSKKSRINDIIGSIYRLITFKDEQQIHSSNLDRRGIFFCRHLPAERQKFLEIPLVQHYSEYLINHLLSLHPDIRNSLVSKWPNKRKFAIALTHDTDAVNIGAPTELLSNLVKSIIRRNKIYFDTFTNGLRYINKPDQNPFYGFPGWKDWEKTMNIRSCFYLFIKSDTLKRDINDCKSSVQSEKINWNVLKEMAKEGWEFGPHPAINAKLYTNEFVFTKKFLENRLEVEVHGLRHHYWALDWINPINTFRKHADAGFKYDSSIAWRDKAGFRASTCLPYRPFDESSDTRLNFYELPTCLLDAHLMERMDAATSDRAKAGIKIIEQVKKVGGAAVIDWHTETASEKFFYTDYFKILRTILSDDVIKDAWIATPTEIIKWYSDRETRILIN